jgi:hypothetical protein
MTRDPNGDGHDRCGADGRTRPCLLPAGWGTDHVGVGRCKLHGGSTPTHVRAAQRAQAEVAVVTYGLPRNVEPAIALIEEVHRTAGHVAWLGALIATLNHDGDGYDQIDGEDGRSIYRPRSGLKQVDMTGRFEKPSVWVELYQVERKHLAAVAKAALDADTAARIVKLEEDRAELIAGGLRWLLAALGTELAARLQLPDVDAVRTVVLDAGAELAPVMLRGLAAGELPAAAGSAP